MLKKTITYKDLDGNDVTDDFYFNLSKTEIVELESMEKDGISGLLSRLIAAEEGFEIIMLFKKIIGYSIGKRAADGKQFTKNQAIRDEFFQSDAYNVFFMELLEDPTEEKGAAFVRAIVPQDLVGEIVKKATDVSLPNQVDDTPAYIRENRDPTMDEFRAMTPDQQAEAFRRKASSQS